MLFDLLYQEVIDEILGKHVASSFHTSNTTNNIGEYLLYTNAFMAPIARFIQRIISEAVALERTMVMENS